MSYLTNFRFIRLLIRYITYCRCSDFKLLFIDFKVINGVE